MTLEILITLTFLAMIIVGMAAMVVVGAWQHREDVKGLTVYKKDGQWIVTMKDENGKNSGKV